MAVNQFGYWNGSVYTRGEKFVSHAKLGMATFIISLVQAIFGLWRPVPTSIHRPLWKLLHRLGGITTFALGAAGIGTGIRVSCCCCCWTLSSLYSSLNSSSASTNTDINPPASLDPPRLRRV